MRNFRDLNVWKDSLVLCQDIYRLAKQFPKSELYGLTSQMTRCAVSIPSNVAEGSSRNSSKDFSRFIQIAMGSAFELETQLIISHNNDYCSTVDFEELLQKITKIQKMLNGLNNAILK